MDRSHCDSHTRACLLSINQLDKFTSLITFTRAARDEFLQTILVRSLARLLLFFCFSCRFQFEIEFKSKKNQSRRSDRFVIDFYSIIIS
jgi:hypothetical protein